VSTRTWRGAVCAVIAAFTLAASSAASALSLQHIAGFPRSCGGGTATSDGSLWTPCSDGIIHVSPTGRISGPFRPPVDPYNADRVGKPTWNVAEVAAGPAASFWFTDDNGLVCEITAADHMRCAGTPLSKTAPREAATTGIAEGAEGNMWVLQTAPLVASIVRVTPTLAMTEYPEPPGWDDLAGLLRSSSGDMWFGGGSSSANTQGIGFITPSGEVTSYALSPEAEDSPEPRLALPDGFVYYVTGDNLEHLDRVTATGAQTVVLKVHDQLELVAAGEESVWAVAQSEKAGAGYHYFKPGALYHVTASGTTTQFPLSGRFKLSDLQVGLGGVPWGIANGYTEKDLHLVSIEASGAIVDRVSFDRTAVPVALYPVGSSAMWVVSARGTGYELSRITG
jgi:hypothetical protein